MIGGIATGAGVDGTFVPARTPAVEAVDAEGEAVLVDEVTDQVHQLNSTGALLWACFDGASSVADICFDLADVLDVPFEQVLADTLAVVDQLLRQGLLYDGRSGPPDRTTTGTLSPADQSGDVPRRRRLLEEPPNA